MKIVFMGTPEFAVPALTVLGDSDHEIQCVLTQPDKAKDRGKKVQFPPVKEKALALGIPVLQPEKLRGNEQVFHVLREYAPELMVVVAYGHILPEEILQLPTLGCINIHASLLPRWRGAAPIQRAILAGDSVTGVTIQRVVPELDAGDMLAWEETIIGKKTAAHLHDELSHMGARLLMKTIQTIENGTVAYKKQDESQVTYAAKVFKQDGHLDFSQEPEQLCRLIRGLDPWPGAYGLYKGMPMKICQAVAQEERNSAPKGVITSVSVEGIKVSAGGKTILITAIQMPGKRRMEVREYLKGNKIEQFDVLE